jgi:hypothetical protein
MARRETVEEAEAVALEAKVKKDILRTSEIVTIVQDEEVPEIVAFKAADEAYDSFKNKHSTLIARLCELAHTRNRALDAVDTVLRSNEQATTTFQLAREPSHKFDIDGLIDWINGNNNKRIKDGMEPVPLENYGIVLKEPEYMIDTAHFYKVLAAGAIPVDVVLANAKPALAYKQYKRTEIP